MAGGKKHTTQTVNTLDPATAAQQAKIYGASDAYANAPAIGADQATLDALKNDRGYAAYGNTGLLALNGDPTAMANFRTPGGEDILKQMDVNAAEAGRAATNATNQSATRAGAFGGKRAAVAQGTAQAGVNAANMNQKAQFQYQQSSDAFSRASAAANLGMGANQNLMAGGDYMRNIALQNDPAYKKLMAYKMGMQGTPYGTSTTNTTTTPWGSVIAGGLLAGGGAYMGAKG